MNNLINRQHSYSAFAFSVAFSLFAGLLISGLFTLSDSTEMYWFANALYSCVLGGSAILFCKMQGIDFYNSVKVSSARWYDFVFVAVAVFVTINFATPINTWFCSFLESIAPNYSAGVSIPEDSTWVQLIGVVCVLAAINEEILFRGVIANGLLSGNPAKGIIISALLFALFHMNPAQTLPQFVLGCVFAVGYYKSQSIVVPIFAHFFSNLSALLLSEFVEPYGFYENYATELAIVGAIVFAVIFFVYCFFAPKKGEKEKFEQPKVSAPIWVGFAFAILWCLFNWVGNMVLV